MKSGIIGAIAFGFIGFLVGFFLDANGFGADNLFMGLSFISSMTLLGAILGLVVGVATHKKK